MDKLAAGSAKVAIIGSGNIGTDLMIKIMRTSDVLEMGAFAGIDLRAMPWWAAAAGRVRTRCASAAIRHAPAPQCPHA